MTSELIDITQYIKIATFAKKVKVNPSLIRYYATRGGLKSIAIDGYLFVHKEEIKKWPPERINPGPKLKPKEK